MKRVLLVPFLFLFILLPLFSLEVEVGGGLFSSARSEGRGCSSLSLGDGKNQFSSILQGGDVLSLSYCRRGNFTSYSGWRLGTTISGYSYGAASLLFDAVLGGRYGTDDVNIMGSFGVQGGFVKYRSLERALFTLSPLASLILEFVARNNLFHVYMSYTMPYGRQIKAVPTYGFEFRRSISPSLSLSINAWGKAAEYLMDPWISFQSYGTEISISVEV